MKRSEGSGSGKGMPFGENLRGILARRKITQAELAGKLGVSQGTVCQWTHGRFYPSVQTLIRIAELLDVSLDELLIGRKQAGDRERNALRAAAVEVIEDTREIYGDLQALNKHARMLERLAKKYRLIEEEEE